MSEQRDPTPTGDGPQVLATRRIPPEALDPDALQVIHRLRDKGHKAYLVGGCVRDLFLGHRPKDFDIATSARPNQVKKLFRNCRIIGRRFKLAHLHFGAKILEVSTFRRTPEEEGEDPDRDPLITQDNVFGTAREDARRRDFTINALFYDPRRRRVIDWVDGLEDLHRRRIRTINDPWLRFREDPVRILRAVKFSTRLHLEIEERTWRAMGDTAADLAKGAPPRILEEILRLLKSGNALRAFQMLRRTGALAQIMPGIDRWLDGADAPDRDLFWRHLDALDAVVSARKEPVENHLALGAAFLHPVTATGRSPAQVNEEMIAHFAAWCRLSRRDRALTRRICAVHYRFKASRRRFKVRHFVSQDYFPEALDLLHISCLATGEHWESYLRWRSHLEQFRGQESAIPKALARTGGAPEPERPAPGPPAGEKQEREEKGRPDGPGGARKKKKSRKKKKKDAGPGEGRKREQAREPGRKREGEKRAGKERPPAKKERPRERKESGRKGSRRRQGGFDPGQTMAPPESRCVIPDYEERDIAPPERPEPD